HLKKLDKDTIFDDDLYNIYKQVLSKQTTGENSDHKESHNSNVSWDVHFEHSTMNISKRTDNKLNKKEIDDDDIYKGIQPKLSASDFLIQKHEPQDFKEEFLNKRYQLAIKSNELLLKTAEFLLMCELDYKPTRDVILALENEKHLIIPRLIYDQLAWCAEKSKTESIANFAVYFMNGLRQRYQTYDAKVNSDAKNGFAPDNSNNIPEGFVPFDLPMLKLSDL
ncbi:TPA: hypothetical protein ACGO1T_001883, partial [Streptococcus suis]